MAEKYTSLMALVLDGPVEDVRGVVEDARASGSVDRHSPVGDPVEAAEVAWGGRMQKAVVRRVEDDEGRPLLRAETYVGAEGLRQGMRRHGQLLRGLAEHVGPAVVAVRDVSADVEHDRSWLDRIAAGEVGQEDAIHVHHEGRGTFWVHTHGAARFDVPDLELYGLNRSQLEGAGTVLRHVHPQLLDRGLQAELDLPDGTPVYLVPVLEAWGRLPLDWPGVGRAGQPREGHDGPRATLSILHGKRFGRYRKDLEGVLGHL